MCAVMMFSKIDNSLINLSLSSCIHLRWIASENLIRLSYEMIFISLITTTDLSALLANVVDEISKLYQSKFLD